MADRTRTRRRTSTARRRSPAATKKTTQNHRTATTQNRRTESPSPLEGAGRGIAHAAKGLARGTGWLSRHIGPRIQIEPEHRRPLGRGIAADAFEHAGAVMQCVRGQRCIEGFRRLHRAIEVEVQGHAATSTARQS